MNKISCIGSGNVAYHLCHAFAASGHVINSISSRNYKSAKKLAEELKSSVCAVNNIPLDTDLVIIAVNDDSIEAVVKEIPIHTKNVVHTSGAIPISVLNNSFENFGVFYPLQSFNKNRKIEFSTIPILIEANNIEFEKALINLASTISKTVRSMGSESRKHLHLAAVFANNFVNLLAIEAYTILEKNNIEGDLIRPLLIETVLRLESNHPKDVMTGPAKRNDLATLKKQEDLLKTDPKLQSLYRQLSQLIMQRFNGSEL